ncbi:MAG: N-6 DNA methylase [Myxococcales bacterium]|nr:N-6 DNA methylase [Myxococcales bacterium]
MAIKKSELYTLLWSSCDKLRGGMDASQYKDYVLVMLFIKYISDKYANSDDFSPPVKIPKGASFQDMVQLKGKSDIGDKINTQIIQPLIDNNSLLARSDFPDFNDPNKLGEGKAMVDRLTSLIDIFQQPELDFSKNRADHDDILGDAYEFLMRHFATESGKSKGQFYTPAEVSRVIAKVIGISPQNSVGATTAYDPTCGSGSLLLKVAAEAGKRITLEGQEKDVSTAGLARMNMILHDFPTATIVGGNTLADPKFKDKTGEGLKTYDYVVANPPFSDKAWSTGITPETDAYQRFEWGVPPAKQGDYAYLLHIIRSMKSTGKAACILPHGVLFRGNAEAVIRQKLVRSGMLKGIIGLPANLFYGTGIPACLLVLDKENAKARKGVFMLDAAKAFAKDGNKNRLREQDIHKIVDTFTKQNDVPRYARMVPFDEISDPKNDYNLNLPRYIDSAEPDDIQDIEGHLHGGIPDRDINALDAYWQVLPNLRKTLFENAGRPGYAALKIPVAQVKATILQHGDFAGFKATTADVFGDWRTANQPSLEAFGREGQPRTLIETIAEDMLRRFQKVPLLDAYDIYQHLMNYWVDTMQDDAYLIAADGWVAKTHRIIEVIKSGKNKGEEKDKGWACDLLPKPFVVARYFAKEQAALDALQDKLEAVEASLEALVEEHSGEEGVLNDVSNKTDAENAYVQAHVVLWNESDKAACSAYTALVERAEAHKRELSALQDRPYLSALKNNKGKLTLKAVDARLAATKDPAERAMLTNYLETDQAQKAAQKKAKALFSQVEGEYRKRLAEAPLPEDLLDLHATVRYLSLLGEQSALKSAVKEADAALDALAYEKYPQLSVDEVKRLVVEDKWLAALSTALHDELERVSQTLAAAIRDLAERYDTPLAELVKEVDALTARVEGHLKQMGFVQ